MPDARYLLPLPDGLTPAQAAPLTDAGLTPFHAVKRSLPKLDATAWAMIIGVGGLGHMAIQILKAMTAARVIAVDTRREALNLAVSLGADVVLDAGDRVAGQVRTATKGLGADVVLDCVGTDSDPSDRRGLCSHARRCHLDRRRWRFGPVRISTRSP